MSVTFYLESGEVCYPPCPDCGKTARDPNYTDCERPDCLGYGPDAIRSTPELNIANDNARAFLRLLGVDKRELWGELDPAEVKRELATLAYRAPSEVRPTVQDQNVITCGLTEDQLGRYAARLFKIATLAERRREPIQYG